ncbi:MAG TPA: hypothetical protein VFV38_45895 [Ktedonobacteraceae bacterium]|nr:hypothetical protein [Ktedonobacteraceae bacterium]
MADTTTFAMDTSIVDDAGRNIVNQVTGDLSSNLTFALVGTDTSSMPTMFTAALMTFQDNLRSTLYKLFNQRNDIGLALQGFASDAELTELKNASSFTWSQSGWVPVPGAAPGQSSSTV